MHCAVLILSGIWSLHTMQGPCSRGTRHPYSLAALVVVLTLVIVYNCNYNCNDVRCFQLKTREFIAEKVENLGANKKM